MTDSRPSKPTIRELITRQRQLSKSERPMKRVIEGLCAAGSIQARLEELADRQLGQLMFDVVWEALPLVSPP